MTATGQTVNVPAEPTPAQLRKFAQEQGLTVASRGTIPASVHAAWAKAPKKTKKLYA